MPGKPPEGTKGIGGRIGHPSNIGPLLVFAVVVTLTFLTGVVAIIVGKALMS